MTADPDWLSDAEAEAMARAADPGWWDLYDRSAGWPKHWRRPDPTWRIEAIRRACAARPATARAVAIASIAVEREEADTEDAAILARGRHLTQGGREDG